MHQDREAQLPARQLGQSERSVWRQSAWDKVLAACTRAGPARDAIALDATTGTLPAFRAEAGQGRAFRSPRYYAKRPRWRQKLAKVAHSRLTLVVGAAVAVLAALVAVLLASQDSHGTAAMTSRHLSANGSPASTSSPALAAPFDTAPSEADSQFLARLQETRAAPARAVHGDPGSDLPDRVASRESGPSR